ncbi:GNAT family N-acetyltransferase [Bacillus sp. SB49]|uniref:GNAT family N-acetyltransferase n=1 Tax=Bacillaceae TaxID=186817 RepID=UPI000421EAB4|nr:MULTISPECIES: GNAT family N-acetyltransferase [Bacillaceae]QHT47584.1 GNAT family N-acetyltransferase [Bacillus sp. SB49]
MADIRRLTRNDYDVFKRMDTGIEDDYVLRIFPRLVESDSEYLYGMFEDDALLSICGISLYGKGRYAMLGRLRSDRRHQGKGCSTNLLSRVIEDFQINENIRWFGGHTQINNKAARRVFSKLGFHGESVTHAVILKKPEHLKGHTPGPVWEEVTDPSHKRSLLMQYASKVFPYECYYPLPYDEVFFTDAYMKASSFYINKAEDRFMIIRNDVKGEAYAHVKYSWDDAFHQPGFYETVLEYWKKNSENDGCWFDFTEAGFQTIPNTTAFEFQDPWILYGQWKRNHLDFLMKSTCKY